MLKQGILISMLITATISFEASALTQDKQKEIPTALSVMDIESKAVVTSDASFAAAGYTVDSMHLGSGITVPGTLGLMEDFSLSRELDQQNVMDDFSDNDAVTLPAADAVLLLSLGLVGVFLLRRNNKSA